MAVENGADPGSNPGRSISQNRKNYKTWLFITNMESESQNINREILNKLKKIEVEIEFIKESMPNKNMFLDAEEKGLLKESYENEKKGLLISAKDARKHLGI